MKIVAIETHLIRVPCDIGAAPTAFVGVGWSSLDTLFVRVVTDQGLEGLGRRLRSRVLPGDARCH